MNAVPWKVILGFSLLILILLIGGGIWYAGRLIKPQTKEPPVPLVKQFLEKDEFPKGVAFLDVDQALVRFDFLKSLPFFDKNNVVQILDIKKQDLKRARTSQQSVTDIPFSADTYVSYRIEGQSMATIRDAYVDYFQSMGLKQNIEWNSKESFVLVLPPNYTSLIKLSLFKQPSVGTKGQEVITVALRACPLSFFQSHFDDIFQMRGDFASAKYASHLVAKNPKDMTRRSSSYVEEV